MTASLFVFVPVALLALITGFYFVGCVLDTSGIPGGNPEPKPFTKYSDTDVIGQGSCVAYWPLSEPASVAGNPVASAKAADVIGGNTGNYTHKGNAPTLFPCPGFQVAPGIDSAQAIGALSLGTESIVPGDAKQPDNDPDILTTGMEADGAFVTIPPSSVVNPVGPFTVEVWARPEWADDPAARRVLIDSRFNTGTAQGGFAIWVEQDGTWTAGLLCSGATEVQVTAGMASLSGATHVVLTFDGTSASLFTNGTRPSSSQSVQAGQAFVPNTTVQMVFGVGNPWLPPRTQPTDLNYFPRFPFKGTIQDVAVYNTVLSDEDIQKHFDDGSGKTTVPAG
jgi:hypothetical protein